MGKTEISRLHTSWAPPRRPQEVCTSPCVQDSPCFLSVCARPCPPPSPLPVGPVLGCARPGEHHLSMGAEGAEGTQTGRMERGLVARWGSHPGSESSEAGPCACQWDTGLGHTTGPSSWTGSRRCCSGGGRTCEWPVPQPWQGRPCVRLWL